MKKKDELLKTLYDYISEKFSVIVTDGTRWNMNTGICYTVSKIGSKILKHSGYNVNVIKVVITSANKKGRKILEEMKKRDLFDGNELVKRGGWAVGIGHIQKDGKKDNHWVIYFEDEDMVMDLTYEQANRPQHKMICKSFFEKTTELPETIVEIARVKPEVQDYLYMNTEPLKSYLKDVVKDGVKLLKRKKLSCSSR